MTVVSVTAYLGPEDDPLLVSSDCDDDISWSKMALPEWGLRYKFAPPSDYVGGDVLLSAVPDSGFVTLTIAITGTSLTDLEAKKTQVQNAMAAWPGLFKLEAVTPDETVIIAGPWASFPVVLTWGDVWTPLLDTYYAETNVSLPVNPPGGF